MQKKQLRPPSSAERFLNWLLKKELVEEVLGDLEEKFEKNLKHRTLLGAKADYWYQTLNYLRPFAIRNDLITDTNPFFMWRHHLKISFRNFQRERSTFLINLIGLSTGLASTLLIALWVMDELKFDKFHEKDAQLYQVMQRIPVNENDVLTWQWTPGILAETLKEEMPEVELATHVTTLGGKGIIVKDDIRFQTRERYVNPDFFNLFSHEIVEGDKATMLKDKRSVILTRDLALKLFKTTKNVIGQTVEWERQWREVGGQFIVAGIIDNPPTHTTLPFELLFSYEFYLENKPSLLEWKNSDPLTVIALKEGTDVLAFDQKIADLIQRKKGEADGDEEILFTRKFSDRYLYGNFENGVQAGGRITYVRLFSIIACFILLIACINFMNLSTAKATRRLKEVGVKKAIGADRKALVSQYLNESFLITFMALGLALFFVKLALPTFNEITAKSLILEWSMPWILIGLGITLLTGFIAGSYPALYLSGFDPASIFKGKMGRSVGEVYARKGLVIFQFALSIILIVAVGVVYEQIQLIQTKNLGYEKDNIIVLQKLGNLEEDLSTFLTEVKTISGVVNASTIDGDLMGNYGYTSGLHWEGDDQENNPIRFGSVIVGKDIIETLGMELIAGKDFTQSNDLGAYIFNEAAIKAMNMDDPIGKVVKRRGNDHRIIGVVKNFHFESLYEEIKPCFLRLGNYGNNVLVKIRAGQEQTTLAALKKYYTEFNPGLPFKFKFLDENYQRLYAAEQSVSTLSRFFAGMAILISCLGLFGLAAFSTQRRRKEIGVRKVLGASTLGIARLLTGDFTKMVLIAILLALPMSYVLAENWLTNFAFRIDLQFWFFIMAGLTALGIALFTVSFQTIRAARMNPVESLKAE